MRFVLLEPCEGAVFVVNIDAFDRSEKLWNVAFDVLFSLLLFEPLFIGGFDLLVLRFAVGDRLTLGGGAELVVVDGFVCSGWLRDVGAVAREVGELALLRGRVSVVDRPLVEGWEIVSEGWEIVVLRVEGRVRGELRERGREERRGAAYGDDRRKFQVLRKTHMDVPVLCGFMLRSTPSRRWKARRFHIQNYPRVPRDNLRRVSRNQGSRSSEASASRFA